MGCRKQEEMEITRCGTCSTISLFFHIDIARSTPGEHLHVVGSHERLGAWDPEHAIRLTTSERAYPVWRSQQIDLRCEPEESFLLLKYKYVLDRRELQQGFLWEENIPDREVRIPWTPGADLGVWLIRDTAFNNQGPSTLRKLDLNSVRVSAIGGLLALIFRPLAADDCDLSGLHLLQQRLDLTTTRSTSAATSDPPTTPPRRPNLLLIVLDQWRWDWDGQHDDVGVALPTIQALGNSGVRFTRAYTPSPLCVPARTAMAAVREYKAMRVKNNSQSFVSDEPGTATFMSVLRDAGYTTMLVGKDHLSDAVEDLSGAGQAIDMQALGFDWYIRAKDKYSFCSETGGPLDAYGAYLQEMKLLSQQCAVYGDFARGSSCNATQVCDSTSFKECGFRCSVNALDQKHSVDRWVRREAERLLKTVHEKNPEKPWFLQVNFLGPHPPLVAEDTLHPQSLPAAIDAHFDQTLVFDLDGTPRYEPHPYKDALNVTETRQLYAQHLIRIDKESLGERQMMVGIGALLTTLHDLAPDAVVVVTGDHGEHLGDHGHFAKASPWEPSIHVPLIIAGATIAPHVEEHPVSLIDVPRTLLDLAAVRPAPSMQGYSLAPALERNGKALLQRPAVMSGLNYLEEFTLDAAGSPISLGRKHFDSAAALLEGSFLKLVCCPSGCRKQGRLVPDQFSPQVALMNVTSSGPEFVARMGFEYDLLSAAKKSPPAIWAAARWLAHFLGDEFREVCLPLLQRS
ncbi:unnamed protein product [Durusdinium trenchii]|uniref:CBM20 domain-containing protein n=1 Tax=Durusdinium trenchii TaxID=1381693 RepID=A0ABP0NY83_9DINO